jgi:general secretion pathway protein M
MIEKLLNSFNGLSERDQKAVKLLLLGLPVLIYLLAIRPTFDYYKEGRETFIESSALLAWMQLHQGKVTQETAQRPQNLENKDIIQLISSEAEKQKVTLDRLQPVGKDQVRIYGENVSFEQLIQWLNQLEQQGLTIEQLSIEKTSAPGIVGFQGILAK